MGLSSQQKGNTMLEAISAIAIAGVLAVAALRLVANLFDLFKQNLVVSEIQELQKNISSRFALEGHYNALAEPKAVKQLVDDKVIPAKMLSDKESDNPQVYHSLSGPVTIKNSAEGDYFYEITFAELSTRGCLNLSQINWTTSEHDALMQLSINGKDFVLPVEGKSPNDADSLPMTMEKAAKACKSGKVNSLTWTFM